MEERTGNVEKEFEKLCRQYDCYGLINEMPETIRNAFRYDVAKRAIKEVAVWAK